MSPGFYYSYRMKPRLFVKRDHASRHKCKIVRSEQALVGYPVNESSEITTNYFAVLPKFKKKNPCKDSKSVPPEPQLLESFHKTKFTAFSVMSTEIKIGISLYVSNVEQVGMFL